MMLSVHSLKNLQFSNTLKQNLSCFAYFFMFAHVVIWSLIPALVRYNLPLDAMEGTLWGHQLEWGYDKNPFLNGWLTALAVYLSSPSGWMVYLFSQLSVASCLWVIWQLGKKMLTPAYAFIALLLLESVQYFNFHAIDFNDNTLELGLWALTIYFFYQSLQPSNHKKINVLHWLATGFFAALALMAKYYTLALLTTLFLFLCYSKDNRTHFKTLGPYLCLLLFFVIIFPHFYWLFHHDFITVKYVFARTSAKPSWTNHIFFPLKFFWQQLQVLIPAILLFSLLFIGKKPARATKLSSFDHSFLLFIALGPFLLTLLLSFIFGITLRAGWGMPLLSFWTLLLLSYFQPELSTKKIYCFMMMIFTLMVVLVSAYAISLIDSKDVTSANFPGQEIANTITKQWQEKYHTQLPYIAGSRWLSGNISFYSKDHPSVWIEWNQQKSPWINLENLKQKGAVFVWNINDHETLPDEIRRLYPALTAIQTLQFSLHRNNRNLPPVKIGIAWLPPQAF